MESPVTRLRSLALPWLLRMMILAGAGLVFSACHSNGATFIVDTTADTVDVDPGDGGCGDLSGFCSLRAAVMESNALSGIDKVVLADGVTYPLTLTGPGEDAAASGDLDLAEGVVISGAGVIDANGIDRVLDVVATTGLVEIHGPDLTGGLAPDGAALRAAGGGQVALLDADIHDNVATAGAPVAVDGGILFLWSDTLRSNTGTTAGGVEVSAGILDLQNTTVSGNTGSGAGGISVSGGAMVMSFSTVTENSGVSAGGVAAAGGGAALRSSIVANQASGADCAGPITSQGHNLESATTCAFTGTGDQQGTDPQLMALGDNGGPVLTHQPTVTSPAVNTTPGPDCTLLGVDARGFARPDGATCDSGAVELDQGADCDPLVLGPGSQLHSCNLTGAALAGADLTGADLSTAALTNADLTGAELAGADLSGADLDGATLTAVSSGGVTGAPAALPAGWQIVDGYLLGPGAALAGAVLTGADLTDANLAAANLANADLVEADLTGADLTDASLLSATVAGATLTGATLTGTDLTGVASGGVIGAPAALPTGWQLASGYLVGPGANLSGAGLAGADLAGVDLSGANLATADLTGADLSGADLTGANAINATMDLVVLTGADLTDADLAASDLTAAMLTGATLTNAILWLADLTNATVVGADLSDANVVLSILAGADLTNAQLTGANLSLANLNNVDFTNADLTDASLALALVAGSDLSGADLTGADLTGIRSGGITGIPSVLPADWQLTNGYLVGPGAALTGADLSGADLAGAVLTATILTGADLSGADLTGADLTGASLTGAGLAGADLAGAILTAASSGGISGVPTALPAGWQLTSGYLVGPGADLTGADLTGADLTGADLTGAVLAAAILAGTDLGSATLTAVSSGGVTGVPSALPNDWQLTAGYLAGPVADLSGADLSGADLTAAVLSFADLSGADLTGATLTGADLSGADFTGATLTGVVSGGIIGTPAALPSGWQLINGYLVDPGATFFVDESHPNASDGNAGSSESAPWRTVVHAAATVEAGETVYVKAGLYDDGIVELMNSGTPGAPIVLSAYPGHERQAEITNEGFVSVGNSYFELRGFKFTHSNDDGIRIEGPEDPSDPPATDIVIANNYTFDTCSSGISVWGVDWGSNPGDYDNVRNVDIEYNLLELGTNGCHNEIITVAQGAVNVDVRFNTIRIGDPSMSGGDEGIDFKEGVRDSRIYNNTIYDLSDKAIYIDGGSSQWDPQVTNIEIFNNLMYDLPSHGISITTEGRGDVDGVYVYNNIVHDVDKNGFNIYRHPGGQSAGGTVRNIHMVNNVSFRNGYEVGGGGFNVNHSTATGIILRNNIAWQNDSFGFEGESETTIDNNICPEAAVCEITSNPKFVDAGGRDFHLRPSSPAIDAGSTNLAPNDDHDGIIRPQGAGIDIGAYEFVP